MPLSPLFYRLRIRNAADSADDLVVTSVRGGANPYLEAAPSGDGTSLDILTGAATTGVMSFKLIDAPTGVATRILTAILADATAQWQLLSRKCYGEISVDGVAWTYLASGFATRVRLVDALLWEVQVGESQRLEQTTQAFASVSAAFPKGTNIIGEPIPGGWGPVASLGLCRFKVDQVTAKRVRLIYQSGPLWPRFESANSLALGVATKELRKRGKPYWQESNNYQGEDVKVLGYFPRLLAAVSNPTTGAAVGTFTPVSVPAEVDIAFPGQEAPAPRKYSDLIDPNGRVYLSWPSGGSPAQPAVNTVYVLRVYALDISEANPIHLDYHPVDVLTGLDTEAGIPYDATAALALRNALGPNLRLRARLTGPLTIADAKSRLVYGPLGITARTNSAGQREYLRIRQLPSSLPSEQIDAVDLRSNDGNAGGTAFDADEKSVVTQVTYVLRRFDRYDPDEDGSTMPTDLVVEHKATYQVPSPDVTTFGKREVSYDVPGLFRKTGLFTGFSLVEFVTALALEIFARFGRGGVIGSYQLLRGLVNAREGDFVTLNLPHVPNAQVGASPVTQRGGLRVVQVTRVTPDPEGPIFATLDAGAKAQPTTAPTFTNVASASDPKRYATISLTNSAALVTAGVTVVRFELSTETGPPAGGMVVGTLIPGSATLAFVSPRMEAGATIQIRARSEQPNRIPSAWTAWSSVTLTALSAVTGLAHGAGANNTERVLTWGNPDASVPVRVRWRPNGASDYEFVKFLPPGSTRYTLIGLVPGTSYDVEVVLADFPPSSATSPVSTLTFAAGAGAPTLSVPWAPAAFAGTLGPGGMYETNGTYGLEVTAAEWPSQIELEVAVETAVGSGAYGAYNFLVRELAVQGYRARTRLTGLAPNDGLRRKLRARAVFSGWTSSGYTAEVVVAPYVAQRPIVPAIPTPTFAVTGRVEGTLESPAAFLLATYAPPTNPHFDYVRYRLRQRKPGGTYSAYSYVQGGRDGDDLIPVGFGLEAEVRLEVVNSDGVVDLTGATATVLTPKFPIAELNEYSVAVLDGSSTTTELVRLDYGREPFAILIGFTPNEHCVGVRVFSEETTAAPAGEFDLNDGRVPFADLAVEPATIFPGYASLPIGALYVIRLPLAATANYRNTTLVPYDRLGRAGRTVIMGAATGDATALPAALTAASNVSVPAGGATLPQKVRNSVTPQSATRIIRCYRNGRVEGEYGPFPAGVPVNIDHKAYSEQVDVWEYVHVGDTPTNTAPRESARTAAFVTTTPTLTLAAPSSWTTLIPGAPGPVSPRDFIVTAVGWTSNNPVRTKAILRRSSVSAAGPWTEVGTLDPFQAGFSYTPGTGTWWFSVIFRLAKHSDSTAPASVGPFPYL